MILAEKIMSLRKQNGWSQEELAEQLNVSRQSVSKWESGSSIPDIEKIIKMSEVFSVSTDYLLKDSPDDEDLENLPNAPVYESVELSEKETGRIITMEFASEFMDAMKNASWKMAAGVSACILSPVVLILLSMLSANPNNNISEAFAVGVGLTVLLFMVAGAVTVFITNKMAMSKYDFLESEQITLKYGVEAVVNRRKESHDPSYRFKVAFGVVLCIISSLPLITIAVSEMGDDMIAYGVCILLIIISIAVFLFVSSGIVNSSFLKLLQQEDYTPEEKANNKKYGPVYGAYWCVIVAGYLCYNFVTNNWSNSWLVWPVAGVLFVPFKMIVTSIANRNK